MLDSEVHKLRCVLTRWKVLEPNCLNIVCRVLHWQFSSSLSTLKMSSHWLLSHTISGEKLANNLILVTFYMVSHFSLAVFKIFLFVFVFQQFEYGVSGCDCPWIYLSWKSLIFFISSNIFFFFFSLSFSFPSGTLIMCMLLHLIVSCGFWGSVHSSLFFFFSFFLHTPWFPLICPQTE